LVVSRVRVRVVFVVGVFRARRRPDDEGESSSSKRRRNAGLALA